jgi:hypothetical protein
LFFEVSLKNKIYKFKILKNMKKTLLFFALVTTVFGFGQIVWNFSEAPFGSSGATCGSTSPTVTFTSTFTVNGLTIGTDGVTNWTGLTANKKTIDGVDYCTRLQSGGGGAPVAPSKIPTTRYLSINVTGNSEVKFGMISSNSTSTRTLIIVNEGETVLDSIVNIGGSSAITYTYNYNGPATKLYFYSRSSGINYYYVSATNVIISGTNNALLKRDISFNGKEILNNKNLNVEVYNVLGKLVASSNTNISTSNFPKGVYLIRPEGINDVLKISIH